jgi:hypothetical protein
LPAAGQAQVALSLVPQAGGTLKHVARVATTTEDPHPANNKATGKTRIKP